MAKHDPWCKWPQGRPCRSYSTDGTLLGAEIAHEMGTTDEDEILEMNDGQPSSKVVLTGMAAEQADWESEDASGW